MSESVRPIRYGFSQRLATRLEEVEPVLRKIREGLEKKRVDSACLRSIRLGIDEALTNAIEHGSSVVDGAIEIAFQIGEREVEVSITDFGGIRFNPEYFEHLATLKDWGEGGRGILLIKNMMDEVYFLFDPGVSTRIVMRKKLVFQPPPASDPTSTVLVTPQSVPPAQG